MTTIFPSYILLASKYVSNQSRFIAIFVKIDRSVTPLSTLDQIQTHFLAQNHSFDLGICFTDLYNAIYDNDEYADEIRNLRNLFAEMDNAVAAAYGWDDIDLGHGFHETQQGLRFTISEEACREVLQQLLKLNHERYAEEVAQGLHDKGAKKKTTKKKAKKEEKILF